MENKYFTIVWVNPDINKSNQSILFIYVNIHDEVMNISG
jgi:hypothetical protein